MITVLKVNKAKGDFYDISFSNGETLKFSEDLLVRYRLLKGQEISEADFAEIQKKVGFDVGLQMVMKYLSYQIHTEKEVRTYLKDKEIGLTDRNNIVQRLKELDLINDQNYGDSYVRTQMRLSDKGPGFISQQLKQKGLQPEEIEQSLSLYGLKEQLEVALKTGEGFLKGQRNKSVRESQQKLRMHLMKKGFASEVITEVQDLLKEEPDEDTEYDSLVFQADKLWYRHRNLDRSKKKMKIKQSLYQKGFAFDLIQRYLDEKEASDDENN